LYNFISGFKPKGTLLDVGCGVGIISLLLTRDFNLQTTIIDKQASMLRYAQHNFRLNNLNVTAIHNDFMEFKSQEKFDYIISNPPFYDQNVQQSQNESLNIARYAQHLPIEPFIDNVKKSLKPRGYFMFCYDAKQLDKLLSTLLHHKLNPEVVRFVHSKVERDAKLVMIVARANSKAMMKILPPLIVFDSTSTYHDEAQASFDKAGTHSIKGDY
jgi:tRNA1(Val) A37 N6-methylase TrmN6